MDYFVELIRFQRFEKVIFLKLDIPLLGPAPSEVAEGTRDRLSTMRLGVSVREGGSPATYNYNQSTLPRSGANQREESHPLGTQWNNALPHHSTSSSPSASGVFVKGIIDGGAAHAVSKVGAIIIFSYKVDA